MAHSPADSPMDYSNVDSDLRVKKTRASKPKVKTGCQTCKYVQVTDATRGSASSCGRGYKNEAKYVYRIRRVKCDETKPSCLRCVRFGHQCDGYSTKTPVKPASSKPSRTLVPKSPSASDSPRIEPSGFRPYHSYPVTQLCIAPKPSLFENQLEYQAFQSFCSRTSAQLTSPISVELWTRLMLQACETSPSIRHAVIAIGNQDPSSPSWPETSVGTLRHQFAFRQYNKSMCLLRRDVAGGIVDLKTTLIACLLFYCFESYHGHHDSATDQVYSGTKQIREWASSFYRTDENGRIRTRLGMENSPVVEEDILRAFQSLEIQVMTFADSRTREAHERYRHHGQASIDEMPSIFNNLEEARHMLELVIARSMHWLRSTMHLHNFSTPASSPSSSASSEADDSSPCSLFFDVDPPFEERLETQKEYERWDEAFKPLLNASRSRSAPHSHFLLASTLRLHWLAGYMSIASNISHSGLVNNGRFTTELEESVDIARILLDQPEESRPGGFVFDMQIIVPLMSVGWIYRHRGLRNMGIQLLQRSPRKEGTWDGIVVGKIMDWLCGIEELALRGEANSNTNEEKTSGKRKGDYVPEWAAARCIKISFDTMRREASVSCLQPVRDSPDSEEIRCEVVIPW
jgi:hypothetical protein